MKLSHVEIVTDRTAESRCDEGFLRLRRLVVRNHYQDGGSSRPYNCDIVYRRDIDAVAMALWEDTRDAEGRRRIRVALRRGLRVPIYLRKDQEDAGREEPIHDAILELVAGVIEPHDEGMQGVLDRARAEAREEAGLDVPTDHIRSLGGPFFPSPGITPEMVYLAAVEARLDERGEPEGDGSVMEEGATVEVLELRDAITRCRDGRLPDAKTEIGLLRLADLVGYIPQLDCFVDELPEELQARWSRLGVPDDQSPTD